jgi:hypothetical protein
MNGYPALSDRAWSAIQALNGYDPEHAGNWEFIAFGLDIDRINRFGRMIPAKYEPDGLLRITAEEDLCQVRVRMGWRWGLCLACVMGGRPTIQLSFDSELLMQGDFTPSSSLEHVVEFLNLLAEACRPTALVLNLEDARYDALDWASNPNAVCIYP